MEKLKIIRDTPTKYHFETKDDHRVDIEHRDRRLVLKLFKWGEETSLELSLNVVLSDEHRFLDVENRIEIDSSVFKLAVYSIDARFTGDLYGDSDDQIQCEDGGVRFELVLKGKPPINSFIIPVTAKNLRFSYQSRLTQEEMDKGNIRPLNVEGSYAVYHASKRDNQYMTGKAFHIYRPIAEDALGNKAWCDISFDKYIDPTSMTITVPQQFLDEVTYPVTIDPDFGYTTAGASSGNLTSNIANQYYRRGSAWAMPAPGGTANYIRARVLGDAGSGPVDCKVFINQKDSGGAGTHGQIATKENLACAEAEHWEEFTLASQALTSGVVYILNILGNITTGKGIYYMVRYDADDAVASYFMIEPVYATPQNPWVIAADATTLDYSIYCNYTATVTAKPSSSIVPLMMTLLEEDVI